MSVDAVREALRAVVDPELGINVVDLGLVYAIELRGAEAHVTFSLTSPACGFAEELARGIVDAALTVPGVDEAYPRLTWEPPWSPERISDDARFALGL